MTGIEFAGVALAVPGVVDVILRGGEAVYEKVETFKTIDKAVNSFRELALDIKEGPLFFGLDALKGASRDRNVPAAIKDQLDKSLLNAESELKLSQEGLQSVHEDTLKVKLVYTPWRGKGSHHQLLKLYASLKTSCDRLKDLCLQLHGFRSAQSSYLWTSDTFKLRHETLDNRPGALIPLSDIVVAAGNYVEGSKRVEADFILERKGRENDVRYLCSILNKAALSDREGILPVMGYRQPPYNEPDGTKVFQLLIELPLNTPMESLANRVFCEPGPARAERLKYCLSMARALASVHSLGLVHKSMRLRTIIMRKSLIMKDQRPVIYLQDWTYIREVSGATTQLETAYEPKHDIYSLGVNMLEILLWTIFVVPGTSGSDRVVEAFESTGLQLGEAKGGLPDRYKGNPNKLLSRPLATRTIWCEVATTKLQGDDLQHLVLGCLKGDFQDVSEVIAHTEDLITAYT